MVSLWPLFGEKMCFLASAKQLKTSPPLFLGCWMQKSMLRGDTGRRNTIYSILTLQKGVFFMLQAFGFMDVMKSYVGPHSAHRRRNCSNMCTGISRKATKGTTTMYA